MNMLIKSVKLINHNNKRRSLNDLFLSIYKLNIKQMTFNKVENEVDDFIHYWNNIRIKEKLNWMTPT